MHTCQITVAIPTYNRPEKLLESLEKILACNPKPDEVIVHIDGNDQVTEAAIQKSDFRHDITMIKSPVQVGPGGGRNVAIAHARNPIVASFDDDSYPIDSDYFQRLQQLFKAFPEAAVIGATIFHQFETVTPDEIKVSWVSEFVGCGCAYRKDVFQQTQGYVQLPLAYGMEEVDLSLRLHDMGWGILQSPWLRVFHNTMLEHHNDARITAASIANQALLAYLRYPVALWWLGLGQCINRISWLLRHGRVDGIVQGLFRIPQLILKHQQKRQSVTYQSLISFIHLRRNAVPAHLSLNSLQ